MKSIIITAFIGFINYCVVVGYGGNKAYGGNKGDQYCEMFWGNATMLFAVMGNYTNCTKSPGFYDLEVEDIQAVHGEDAASMVAWNGIREWLVDDWVYQEGFQPINDRAPYSYGSMFPDGSGFEMIQIAEMDFSNMGPNLGGFYTDSYSERYATAVYKANEWIYEVISKDCSSIYVMQSYYLGRPGEFSGLTDPSQLKDIGERLQLPDGWRYRARVLEEDLLIDGVNGITTVMQDDMRNSYSAMDEPFDKALCSMESAASII